MKWNPNKYKIEINEKKKQKEEILQQQQQKFRQFQHDIKN